MKLNLCPFFWVCDGPRQAPVTTIIQVPYVPLCLCMREIFDHADGRQWVSKWSCILRKINVLYILPLFCFIFKTRHI
jgi:hypothetical protein